MDNLKITVTRGLPNLEDTFNVLIEKNDEEILIAYGLSLFDALAQVQTTVAIVRKDG